ncbi:MAG: ferrous iron transport protein A [Oscillospiraceae bacterium]|nr:ferrous iron transport protein A [Oscillospiraceae bacterium]
MLPLAMANVGDTITVSKINGKDEVRQHLAELGFVIGADVYVVNKIGGNLILQIKDSRVAVDQSVATRIMVEV